MLHLLLPIIYLAFISLGLPDSLLGSAWPTMYKDFGTPVSYAGILSMIIALGTIVSSLCSDKLTLKWGTGKVTAASVAMTAIALLGFSTSHSFWMLCLWAIPYGLGAGSVDASLNNYVALHFASRHMSWLHCMWGIGASLGPYIMGAALTGGQGWNAGYRYIALLQIGLTAILLFSLPLWKNRAPTIENAEQAAPDAQTHPARKALSFREILRIPGAGAVMLTFFFYCALEQTTSLWASSYLMLNNGFSPERAAGFASMFFIGITLGRAAGGFMTLKWNDTQMVRRGQAAAAVGIGLLLLPGGALTKLLGLMLVGLGCAPIYPCIIHATPACFGADRSQAVIGVEMASAYIGTCLMPPLFGWLGQQLSVSLFPLYLLVMLAFMVITHELLLRKTKSDLP